MGCRLQSAGLLALVEKGMSREEAYTTVQSCAHQAWNQPEGNFHALIIKDPRVMQLLSPKVRLALTRSTI